MKRTATTPIQTPFRARLSSRKSQVATRIPTATDLENAKRIEKRLQRAQLAEDIAVKSNIMTWDPADLKTNRECLKDCGAVFPYYVLELLSERDCKDHCKTFT